MNTFSAIAHPTRRAVLDILIHHEHSAGDLVAAFPKVSQPAISRHLRVLRNAGLVNVKVQAQQRIYNLKPKALTEVEAWVNKYQAFWPDRLNALDKHLATKQRERSGKK